MKTIFEKKLNWYSKKAFLAKKTWVRPVNITYAIKRWPKLKPELKEKYYNGMIEINAIKQEDYTIETLFSYTD